MKICFVEIEPAEREYFEAALDEHELVFEEDLRDVPRDAEVLSTFIYSRIDEEFLANHPDLRLVATRSTGYDHVDMRACARHNVAVALVPTYGDNTVAEHTFALILASSRRLREARESLNKRNFSYEAIRGFDLKQKTLGVIGTGRIGLHVTRLAKAFDMKVLAYDIAPQDFMAEMLGFEYAPFEELLKRADIITLHVPLVAETFHLLNADTLKLCKQGAILINTARGGLIDTDALLAALESGHIGGAGLDVLEDEQALQGEPVNILSYQIVDRIQQQLTPDELRTQKSDRIQQLQGVFRNRKLIGLPSVVFTPHIAFNSYEAVEKINGTTVANIKCFLKGEPCNLVPTPSNTPER